MDQSNMPPAPTPTPEQADIEATTRARVAALKREAATLKHNAEHGVPGLYDLVRKALGPHNPDGDATNEQLCGVISRLAHEVNCLPTPNGAPVPEPTEGPHV
jgi:hypothetical protein